MIDATYKVIFSGQIRTGYHPVEVRQKFQQRFNISPQKMDYYFSGKPIILMKDMTFAKAEKLVAAINAVGAEAQMEAVTPSIGLQFDLPPEPEPEETPNPEPEPETQIDIREEIKRQREAEEAERKATQRKHQLGCAGIFLGVALIALMFSAGNWFWEGGKRRAPGVLAPNAPLQTETGADPFFFQGYQVVPLADFSLEARVLSRKHYKSDATADISPTDLALGWGPMSDTAILKNIDISQDTRFYFWRPNAKAIPNFVIGQSSSNMHMVPSDDFIRSQLKKVRKGDLIRLNGHLIEVNGNNGFKWRSSLSRSDTGNGACEIIWLKRFEIL